MAKSKQPAYKPYGTQAALLWGKYFREECNDSYTKFTENPENVMWLLSSLDAEENKASYRRNRRPTTQNRIKLFSLENHQTVT
jgi:hypothetical protein